MSETSSLASIDWPTVAAAIGTLIGTIWISLKGIQKGKQKIEGGNSEITTIVGASLMETATVRGLSDQLRDNTTLLRENASALRENTNAINRNTDVHILTHRN